MSNNRTYLDSVYALSNTDETLALYSDWAKSYDDELRAAGYASPGRVAAALAASCSDKTAPVLDVGCGTGLSGEALCDAGFSVIDGTDFSQEMLEVAQAKNFYRKTSAGSPDQPLPGEPGEYQNITAVGVFSPGHADAGLISVVIERLPVGGCFAFTLNEHALEDPTYEACISELVEGGAVSVAFKEHGDHLPNVDLKSTVYVLKRR